MEKCEVSSRCGADKRVRGQSGSLQVEICTRENTELSGKSPLCDITILFFLLAAVALSIPMSAEWYSIRENLQVLPAHIQLTTCTHTLKQP